ncbi:MAG: SpoIID/LytB domain-containing protein [Eubacteriales bacterium]|nr:SpoIID/LytB domain-containing protein [Eubacteriales bacterium]
MKKRTLAAAMLCCAVLTGCAAEEPPAPAPTVTIEPAVAWPEDKLELNETGVPMLDVYVADNQAAARMSVESYLEGVLAGEMKNDWPMEALKAQAILARTFVLKFVDEKESRYPGADISTDIEEAQAYDAAAVNDRIRQAVAETRGKVLASDGELIFAWFHAHSGGTTERAVPGLGWDKEEPAYTAVVKGNEPEQADEPTLAQAAEWEADFSLDEFAAAAQKQGKTVTLNTNSILKVGERGESGRAVTLICGDDTLNASSLRIALGSTKMRSTLLTSFKLADGKVHMAGKGYGHGVGMSQWGAYGMAQQGQSAEQIATHYFENVEIAKLW